MISILRSTPAVPSIPATGIVPRATKPRFTIPAIALFAGAVLFAGHAARAADTEYDVLTGQTDLTALTTYTTGGTAGTGAGGTTAATGPTVTSDVTFDSGTAYSPAAFTLGSSEIFGSLNDLSTTALTVSNTGGAAADTLTLGGAGDLGDGVPGSNAADLLFVGTGANLTITGGTGNTALGLVLGQSGNFDIVGTGVATISSIISDGGSVFGLTKTGTGTLTLSGANTYTGATSLGGGVLTLTGSLSSTVLNLNGGANGGTLNYSATGTNTQSFTTTNLNGFAVVNNTVATDTLNLGNIVRTSPGTVSFLTATGKITTTTANTNGIIGPWATVGSGSATRYAVGNGAATAISLYTAGTGLTASGGGTADTTNFTVGAALTLTAPVTGYTLRATANAAYVLNNGGNNITLDGFLNAEMGGGLLTITGAGSLMAGATRELDIVGDAIALTVNSVIADSTAGSSSLVFSAVLNNVGSLVLGGANTYTGDTLIGSGSVNASNALALQNSTVQLNGGSLVFSSTVTGRAFTLGGLSGAGNLTLANNATTPAAIALTAGGNNASTTYSGILSGAGSLTKAGTGTLTLTGANTYAGGTTVNAGALLVNNTTGSGLGSGVVTVGLATGTTASGTLGGTGILTVTSVTVNANGTLAPGATPGATTGALTLNTTGGLTLNGTLVIGISGTGDTSLITTGALTLSGATLTLNGTLNGTSNYAVATYGTLTGTFTNFTAPSGYTINYSGTSFGAADIELDATAVPEPSTWTAGLLCLGLFGFQSRRRIGWLRVKR